MKCYNHDAADAVAICKNCNKALCRVCAADVGNGIACRNSCEQEVISLNELVKRNKTVSQKTSYAYQRNAVISLLLALVFIYLSLDAYRENRHPLLIMTAGSALIFLLAAFFNYSTSKKFMNRDH
ncbi:MAG TPA: hypothetical protein VF747_11410 [Blastocatellia bacterium]|jgi:preprotein translocase subunit SecF